MLTELGIRMDEHSEIFNKERNYKKVTNRSNRVEEHKKWTESYARKADSRLDETEERITDVKHKGSVTHSNSTVKRENSFLKVQIG